jgi:hypothetical protein
MQTFLFWLEWYVIAGVAVFFVGLIANWHVNETFRLTPLSMLGMLVGVTLLWPLSLVGFISMLGSRFMKYMARS